MAGPLWTPSLSPIHGVFRGQWISSLTKPEITLLVVLATGSMMASTGLDQVLFPQKGGTALLASGSATLNQYLERAHDAKMRRTARRPLPAGRVTPQEALYFGLGLSLSGMLYLAFTLNALTSLIGLVALLSYLLLYTPLKRRTPLCIPIGAFPGAAPVLMGWSAGGAAPTGPVCASFLWQFPMCSPCLDLSGGLCTCRYADVFQRS